ncbi:MAG: helix-turn-helix domain-containing protein [Solirubrobacteraceae bacterium]|nr:helix-turn-helix domain-containing protein [Solirubrobacteraceae bacterium]
MDREGLAEFLRLRREALQPADVGIDPGQRRRTAGLRREEVASLAAMSTDFYTRLEQARGSHPSETMVAAVARALRLSPDERDHAYRLAGYNPPVRVARTDHPTPALLRIISLLDTPAQITSDLGVNLAQNSMAIALMGNQMRGEGLRRNMIYRWFTEPDARARVPAEDHPSHSRNYVSTVRTAHSRTPDDPEANALVDGLLAASSEFAELWAEHPVGFRLESRKRFQHPSVGLLHLDCQYLTADNLSERVIVFTAAPGSPDAEKLRLLSVVGDQFSGVTAHPADEPG